LSIENLMVLSVSRPPNPPGPLISIAASKESDRATFAIVHRSTSTTSALSMKIAEPIISLISSDSTRIRALLDAAEEWMPRSAAVSLPFFTMTSVAPAPIEIRLPAVPEPEMVCLFKSIVTPLAWIVMALPLATAKFRVTA